MNDNELHLVTKESVDAFLKEWDKHYAPKKLPETEERIERLNGRARNEV